MARKPTIAYPGALYHVILPGNDGQTIFFDDKDRTRFYLLLQEGIERFGHRVHGFCLMTNHVHLAIQMLRAKIINYQRPEGWRHGWYWSWESGLLPN
jgi:putative transposase